MESVARAGDRGRFFERRCMMPLRIVFVVLVCAQLLAGCIFVPDREGRGRHEEHEHHDEYRR